MAELVFALRVAEQFERAVGDDLVGAHVRRGARAALDHVHDELVMQLAGEDFVARLGDGVGDLAVQHAEFGVGQRGGLLHARQRADEMLVVADVNAGERKVLDRADGLHAVVGVVRHVAFAERIVLAADVGERRRAAFLREPLRGRPEPVAQPPGNLADEAVEDFGILRAHLVQFGARNLPDLRALLRHGGGAVRRVVEHHAFAEDRARLRQADEDAAAHAGRERGRPRLRSRCPATGAAWIRGRDSRLPCR